MKQWTIKLRRYFPLSVISHSSAWSPTIQMLGELDEDNKLTYTWITIVFLYVFSCVQVSSDEA